MAIALDLELSPMQPPSPRAAIATGLLAPERRALTIGLVLVITLVAFEGLAVATVMPVAQRDLGGLRYYGWTFSAFLLASLVGICWAGEQADARGPARPFVVGLALFAAGLVIAGLAPSMLVLVGGRAVQGLGAGAIPAVAYVSIGRNYGAALRPRMFAILASAWVIPGLVGPALASGVAQYTSWRLVFLGLLPLVALAAALALPALRRLGPPASAAATTRSTPRAIVLAAGAALALAGATTGSLLIAAPLIFAGVTIAVIALRLLVPAGTLRGTVGLPAAIAANGLMNMAFFGAEAFIPLMLTTIRHQSTLFAGLALTAATLTWTSGSWLQERLHRRVDRPALIRAGIAFVVVGIAATAMALSPSVPVAIVAVGWGIAGLGMGLAYSSFSITVLASAEDGQEGATSSALKLVEVLSSAVGIGIGGAFVAAGEAGGWERPAVAAAFALMAGAAALGIAIARGVPQIAGERVEAA